VNKPKTSAPKPSHTLIVFNEPPENLSFYLVPRGVEETREMLASVRAINGMYMNSDEFMPTQVQHFDAFSQWTATPYGKSCRTQTPIKHKIVEVLLLGFAL